MFLSISESGFGADVRRIDPVTTLSNECLSIFYDTVKQFDKVTTKEWNDLIRYVQYLNEFYKNNPMDNKVTNMIIVN